MESHASASPQGGPVQQGYWQGLQYTEQIPQLSDIGMFSAYYHRLNDGEDEDRPLLVSHAHFIHSFIHFRPPLPTFGLHKQFVRNFSSRCISPLNLSISPLRAAVAEQTPHQRSCGRILPWLGIFYSLDHLAMDRLYALRLQFCKLAIYSILLTGINKKKK